MQGAHILVADNSSGRFGGEAFSLLNYFSLLREGRADVRFEVGRRGNLSSGFLSSCIAPVLVELRPNCGKCDTLQMSTDLS